MQISSSQVLLTDFSAFEGHHITIIPTHRPLEARGLLTTVTAQDIQGSHCGVLRPQGRLKALVRVLFVPCKYRTLQQVAVQENNSNNPHQRKHGINNNEVN